MELWHWLLKTPGKKELPHLLTIHFRAMSKTSVHRNFRIKCGKDREGAVPAYFTLNFFLNAATNERENY